MTTEKVKMISDAMREMYRELGVMPVFTENNDLDYGDFTIVAIPEKDVYQIVSHLDFINDIEDVELIELILCITAEYGEEMFQ